MLEEHIYAYSGVPPCMNLEASHTVATHFTDDGEQKLHVGNCLYTSVMQGRMLFHHNSVDDRRAALLENKPQFFVPLINSCSIILLVYNLTHQEKEWNHNLYGHR